MRAVHVPGSSGSTTSTVYVHHGKVVGCSCSSHTYHPRQSCKHMQDQQAELDQPPACTVGAGLAVPSCVHIVPARCCVCERARRLASFLS